MLTNRILARVKCRVCKIEVYRQNYKDHLERQHPGQDKNDLRCHGQQKLFDASQTKKRKLDPAGAAKENERIEREAEAEIEVRPTEVEDLETEDIAGDDEHHQKIPGIDEDTLESLKTILSEEEVIAVHKVNKKLELVLEKLNIEVDMSSCVSQEEEMDKCIEVLEKSAVVKQQMKKLTEAMHDLKLTAGEEAEPESAKIPIKDWSMKESTSMRELTEAAPEYCYEADKGCVVCQICDEKFLYEKDLKTSFTGENLSQKFSSLKRNLRRHLTKPRHLSKVKEEQIKEEQWEREESRNKAVGMRIGRLVYFIVFNARADTDLPILIYMLQKAGTDVGDINHSKILVSKLLPFIAKAVEDRVHRLLSTPMVATGCLPPVNMMADKATDKRDSRHLIGALTYNPGGSSLYKAVFLGCPLCARGTGDHLTESITAVTDKCITPVQYCGFTGTLQ